MPEMLAKAQNTVSVKGLGQNKAEELALNVDFWAVMERCLQKLLAAHTVTALQESPCNYP